MARTRSRSYPTKRQTILDVAAATFAVRGYAACKVEDIAEECGVSKSSIYHYFERKEDILFEILRDHVTSLNETIRTYLHATPCDDRHEFFRGFIRTYLSRSSNARERHAVTLNDTRYLKHDQMVLQEALERRNRDLIVELLRTVNPNCTLGEYKVSAMLLIGMINWVELWFREQGPMSRVELYDRISCLFLDGFLAAPTPKGSSRSRRRKAVVVDNGSR